MVGLGSAPLRRPQTAPRPQTAGVTAPGAGPKPAARSVVISGECECDALAPAPLRSPGPVGSPNAGSVSPVGAVPVAQAAFGVVLARGMLGGAPLLAPAGRPASAGGRPTLMGPLTPPAHGSATPEPAPLARGFAPATPDESALAPAAPGAAPSLRTTPLAADAPGAPPPDFDIVWAEGDAVDGAEDVLLGTTSESGSCRLERAALLRLSASSPPRPPPSHTVPAPAPLPPRRPPSAPPLRPPLALVDVSAARDSYEPPGSPLPAEAGGALDGRHSPAEASPERAGPPRSASPKRPTSAPASKPWLAAALPQPAWGAPLVDAATPPPPPLLTPASPEPGPGPHGQMRPWDPAPALPRPPPRAPTVGRAPSFCGRPSACSRDCCVWHRTGEGFTSQKELDRQTGARLRPLSAGAAGPPGAGARAGSRPGSAKQPRPAAVGAATPATQVGLRLEGRGVGSGGGLSPAAVAAAAAAALAAGRAAGLAPRRRPGGDAAEGALSPEGSGYARGPAHGEGDAGVESGSYSPGLLLHLDSDFVQMGASIDPLSMAADLELDLPLTAVSSELPLTGASTALALPTRAPTPAGDGGEPAAGRYGGRSRRSSDGSAAGDGGGGSDRGMEVGGEEEEDLASAPSPAHQQLRTLAAKPELGLWRVGWSRRSATLRAVRGWWHVLLLEDLVKKRWTLQAKGILAAWAAAAAASAADRWARGAALARATAHWRAARALDGWREAARAAARERRDAADRPPRPPVLHARSRGAPHVLPLNAAASARVARALPAADAPLNISGGPLSAWEQPEPPRPALAAAVVTLALPGAEGPPSSYADGDGYAPGGDGFGGGRGFMDDGGYGSSYASAAPPVPAGDNAFPVRTASHVVGPRGGGGGGGGGGYGSAGGSRAPSLYEGGDSYQNSFSYGGLQGHPGYPSGAGGGYGYGGGSGAATESAHGAAAAEDALLYLTPEQLLAVNAASLPGPLGAAAAACWEPLFPAAAAAPLHAPPGRPPPPARGPAPGAPRPASASAGGRRRPPAAGPLLPRPSSALDFAPRGGPLSPVRDAGTPAASPAPSRGRYGDMDAVDAEGGVYEDEGGDGSGAAGAQEGEEPEDALADVRRGAAALQLEARQMAAVTLRMAELPPFMPRAARPPSAPSSQAKKERERAAGGSGRSTPQHGVRPAGGNGFTGLPSDGAGGPPLAAGAASSPAPQQQQQQQQQSGALPLSPQQEALVRQAQLDERVRLLVLMADVLTAPRDVNVRGHGLRPGSALQMRARPASTAKPASAYCWAPPGGAYALDAGAGRPGAPGFVLAAPLRPANGNGRAAVDAQQAAAAAQHARDVALMRVRGRSSTGPVTVHRPDAHLLPADWRRMYLGGDGGGVPLNANH